jgi:hypothetical protein
MRVAFYANAFDTKPQTQDLTWDQLVERFSKHRISPKHLCAHDPCNGRDLKGKLCPGKNGPAWSPAELDGPRSNENVRGITVGVFDIDHPPDDSWFGRLEVSSVAYIVHSTHQYPAEERYRLIMPLSRTVKPEEWHRAHAAILELLGLPADPLKDLARIYFEPNSIEGTEPLFTARPGNALNVDEIVRQRPATATPAPSPSASEPVDVDEIAAQIRKHASDDNRPLVAQALRGEGLGPKSGANPYGGQDNALIRLMSTAAFCCDAPWEAIEHLFGPTFAATDWGEGTDALVARAKEKFDLARERKAKRDAERAAENAAMMAAVGIARGAATPLDEGDTDPDKWPEKLIWTTGKEPKLTVCEANVIRVLCNAPEWKDKIRFNQVTKKLELRGAPSGKSIEALDVEISVWFQESAWGKLGLNPTPRMVGEALRALPERTGYDPLLDFLDGLRWDGVNRLDTFLERYFGAITAPGDPSTCGRSPDGG